MPRALIIDDDDIARELVVSILRNGGYETFELSSPIGASQMISREKIELLILDIMMPGLSGDKLAKMLRANPRFGRIGIVLVSSCNPKELENLATSVRADAVVLKPEIRQKLLPTLMRVRASFPKERSGQSAS
jgi:two-component system chemotaxis sensor kinase CheA/two-component system sensor histidine kinase and response regulator WspE